MGFTDKLTFPTVDVIARRVAEFGTDQVVLLFKIDLSGYFRQLPLDPGDYSLMCFTWNDEVYFDVVLPMGLRSTPYFAQRVSNAIKYVHNSMGYFLFNYMDDFIGAEGAEKVNTSFTALQHTLRDVGIAEAKEKRVQPTHKLNCVGTLVDTESRMLEVLPERLVKISSELSQWKGRKTCTLKELQQLIGKLQFICAVVRPGRLFLARMLEKLRECSDPKSVNLSEEFRKDIKWWVNYLTVFNGVSILWMLHIKVPDKLASSDACLQGMGAVSGKEYIKLPFPQEWRGRNIAELELLAIVVTTKVWLNKFEGKSVTFKCDNKVVVEVLNCGRARDKMLLKLMRELVFVAATRFEFNAVFLPGKVNTLPDLLSRWGEGEIIHKKFNELT